MSLKRIFRSFFSFVLCLSAVFLMVAGCGPSPEVIAIREARLTREIDIYLNKIQELYMDGQEELAMAFLERGFKNKKYLWHCERFFELKVDLMLSREEVLQVETLVLDAWKTKPYNAKPVFGRVHDYYRQREDYEAIRQWCDSLLALDKAFPEELHGQVLNWKLTAVVAQQDASGIKACFDSILAKLKIDDAAPMFQNALIGLVDRSHYDLAINLIQYLESKKLQSDTMRNMLVTLSMRCALADKTHETIAPAFTACVEQLPDDQLSKITRMVFGVLQRDNKTAMLEQCARQVIFNAVGKHNSVNHAARVWLESGVKANRKVLPERLDALLNAKVSPIQVGNLFDRYFYEMVDDLDLIRSLCAVGERIVADCSDESTINAVKVKVLDGAFITDNFDQAILMLEKGIPGKDKVWHDMSIPKVKAHRAMAQGKPRDAVQYFREFMNAWIASDQEEEYDPTSGIAYSREWILGRNANRIANILSTIPDQAMAAEARKEAKAYFREAIKKAAGDADALKLLEAETKDMGL
ncbi:MAG: hypothetical protein PHU80_10565 [Kiritimatiellae bacterium]|nr:hypothetical protein [Kiritimatiellia bacterium]